ncbi:MAG: S8 family serine peptidase [Elusimicrobiota bacterium]
MIKKYLLLLFIILPAVYSSVFGAGFEYMIEGRKIKAVEGEILVKFKEKVSKNARRSLHQNTGGRLMSSIKNLRLELIKIPPEDSYEKILEKYNSSEKVEYAEPNIIYSIDSYKLPDRYASIEDMEDKQWGLVRINAHYGWEIETGLEETVIAIIDSGIDYNHPDLAPNMWEDPENGSYGYDFVNEDNDPWDDYDHGTHVAGIAVAESSEEGVVGVCWKSRLMALKVINEKGEGDSAKLSSAIAYAADKGADIINISLGGEYSKAVEDAVDYAYGKGLFLAASSGNDGESSVMYPAALNNVLAVGASNKDDERADFSNYGESLDVIAPGVDILSTLPGDKYGNWHGTSMAAPFASGLAALIVSRYKNLSLSWEPEDLKRIINSSARRLSAEDWNEETGHGIIDANSALKSIRPFVSTLEVIEKTTSGAELRGELESLGSCDNARVFFLYRQVSSDTFNTTQKTEKAKAEVFRENIDMLEANTEYLYRAAADYDYEGSAEGVKGSTFSFYTYQKAPVKVESDDEQYEDYRPQVSEDEAVIKWMGESSHTYRIERNGVFLAEVTGNSKVEYTDTGLEPSTEYNYEIFSLNQAGEYDCDAGINIKVETLAKEEVRPTSRFITPSSPLIDFGPKASEVLITDMKGREIASLRKPRVVFDPDADYKGDLESGVYLYRIKTKEGEAYYGTISVLN